MIDFNHSVSVAAVIVDDEQRVLLVQRRDNGHWEPPGGVLETHERIEDGLRREVREETGLDIEVERLSGIYKNVAQGILAIVFRARQSGGSLTATQESSAFQWATAADVRRLVQPVYVVRVTDALEQGDTRMYDHDGTQLL